MATNYPLAGKDGAVSGDSGAAKVRAWEATIDVDLHDVSNFDGDGWKEFVVGLQGCTGTLRCVGTAPTKGSKLAITLSEGTGGVQLAGSVYFQSVRYNVDIGAEIGHEGDFTFDGSVVVSDAA